MAQSTEIIRQRKQELALSLDSSRTCLSTSGRSLRRRLSPGHALGSYFRRHPLQIFGATTAGVAFLTYLLRPRPHEKTPQKPISRRIFGWGISLIKPVIRAYALNQAKEYLRPNAPETDSLLGP
jgi:hypothetical protein